jgi:hypothetical protein
MGEVNWALGLQQGPGPGEAFMQAFEKGQQRKKEMAVDDALRALIANPNDPDAVNNLARHDPRAAMQVQQRQQQSLQQKLEAERENILKGAQIIRQVQPKDQASWDMARNLASQMGMDVSQIPPQFDPQYVQGVVTLADTFAPPKAQDQPTSYEEYQRAQADPNYAKFLEERRGPLIANNGDGTFTIIPRSQAAPNPAPQQPGAVPPPPPGFVVDGGPTPPASGPFPAQGH